MSSSRPLKIPGDDHEALLRSRPAPSALRLGIATTPPPGTIRAVASIISNITIQTLSCLPTPQLKMLSPWCATNCSPEFNATPFSTFFAMPSTLFEPPIDSSLPIMTKS